ncbi:helix-turn-helix transcriptional regulator [Paraburkholderia fungorum]|uniref:helix-turn-helix transcriptional regulator n=1 Tax=Paraburkholderia fungorum TaxID=134537 RepID=UPI00248D7D5B|nr:AlpA family phage regulatory protein [Paraburkholderia fungorum]
MNSTKTVPLPRPLTGATSGCVTNEALTSISSPILAASTVDCGVNIDGDSPSAAAHKTTAPVTQTSDRIVRLPELLATFQISRTTAYAWQKTGLLPRSVALGPRARGWKLSDIERFLASLGTEARDD